ncbi:MAG: hypothetical protein IPH13_20465 [Planctomycetes bacterium]|nr:hypothetical protein [Planctomycetota bacterium]
MSETNEIAETGDPSVGTPEPTSAPPAPTEPEPAPTPAPAVTHTPTEEQAPPGDPAAAYLANTGDGEIRATVLAVLTKRLAERIRRSIAADCESGRASRLHASPLVEVETRAELLADRIWSSK